MGREINIEIPHVRKICSRCHIPYMIIVGSDNVQTCPYCSNEFYTNDILELKKIIAQLKKETEALKRSNAALKGVITKMRGGTMITPVNKAGKDVVETDPYEVDLRDLENYDVVAYDRDINSCTDDCDLDVYFGCSIKGFSCNSKIGAYQTFKLKPNIKADIESGKAVAKGGKR